MCVRATILTPETFDKTSIFFQFLLYWIGSSQKAWCYQVFHSKEKHLYRVLQYLQLVLFIHEWLNKQMHLIHLSEYNNQHKDFSTQRSPLESSL